MIVKRVQQPKPTKRITVSELKQQQQQQQNLGKAKVIILRSR